MIASLNYFASEEIRHFFPEGITSDTPVSPFSKFGDAYWYFYDKRNPRHLTYSPAALTVSWLQADEDSLHAGLPESTLQVVKLYAFLQLHAPSVFGLSRKKSGKNHPSTVCNYVKNLVPFLGHVYEKSLLDGGVLPPASTLQDISVRHLRESLRDWDIGRGEDLRRALICLANSVIQNACEGFAPLWTPADIRSLKFRMETSRDDYVPVFPNPLFRLISNSATDDVAGFLRFMGEESASAVEGEIQLPFYDLVSVGPEIFEIYVELRLRQDAWQRYKQRSALGDGMRAKKAAMLRLGATPGELLDYLHRVHEAACSLIALYTGARYSDLSGFKKGCLKKIRGMWFLVGTHIKHEDLDKPVDGDLWPAIPALRDALRCLELFTRFTQNEYLISGLTTVKEGEGRPYSPNGLADALERYVRWIDVDDTWTHLRVSTHRCRHTLAHQLARADLGLVFIAHQLKHLYSALRAVPPQVTLTYGKIADLKTERALLASELHYEVAKSLYDPDSPIAGGGAEEFMQRRKQYFEGMMASGMTKEDIIRELASKGIPLSSVGMGYCLGRRVIKNKDGSTQKPPCMGSLQCSPGACNNAVITTSQIHLWKKVATQNREMAALPTMQHARTELVEKASHAESVLSQLGVVQ
ncbi:hypothetical protein Q3O98_21115 [Ralstonia pseudosolanacearum]|uniref:hypothetical protein n=1 Tax=Ralstonia pseudosolanacearum TaxID=1310165 RepID=UPI0026744117|nr:hypothetical protein [Ralstonia pseudosolanacearum]MDO3623580.1 hypothetical protein [Ralstonia pseudosolanacearum]